MQIEGNVAVVTGAASGLGEATARRLHAQGAEIVIADMNDERGRAVADELGDRAEFVHCDVTSPEMVGAAIERATARGRFGDLRPLRGRRHRGPHARTRRNAARPRCVPAGHRAQPDRHVQRVAPHVVGDVGNEPDDRGERGVCVQTASIAGSKVRSARSRTARPRPASSG